MEPVIIPITPSVQTVPARLDHFAGTPATYRITESALYPIAGATQLVVEIRGSRTDTSTAKASTILTSPTGAGPWDLDLTSAQWNQPVGSLGLESKDYWLVIYTTTGSDLQVLYTAIVHLAWHNASLSAPSPPNAALALTQSQADALYATLASFSTLTSNLAPLLFPLTAPGPNLPRLRLALDALRAGTSDVILTCFGDSTTWGNKSSTTATSAPRRSYPRQLASMIPGAAPGVSNGPKNSTYPDTRWTVPTGWITSEWGAKGYETGSATQPLRFTPDDGVLYDRFYVYFVCNPGGGTATITATGGTAVTSNLNTTAQIRRVTVSCPESRAAVVTIANSGQVWVLGVEGWHSTQRRMRIGNLGICEFAASTWAAPGAIPAISPLSMVAATTPHAVILSLGLNDAAAQISPAAFKASMQTIITAVSAYADVILWIPLPSGASPPVPLYVTAGVASYVAKFKELATENNLLLVDTYARMGSAFQAAALDADQYHPNDNGYGAIAAAIKDALLLPDLPITGVTAGTYGSASLVPIPTIDAKGRITSITTASIASGAPANLATPRTISTTGDVTYTSDGFDGSANVTGTATLASTGVTATTYGGASAIPVLTVDAKGRITSASNATPTYSAGSLTGSTLASGVTASSLTSAAGGTFASGAFATAFNPAIPGPIGGTTPSTATLTGLTLGASGNLFGGTNLIEQRNLSNPQAFLVYNGVTVDGTSYERGFFRFVSNVLEIGAERAGSTYPTARNVQLMRNGAVQLILGSGGLTANTHLIFNTDNAYDIGASGATRPRTIYIGSVGNTAAGASLVTVGTAVFGGSVQSLYQRFGTGTPEANVAAPVGAVYHRTDGGAGTSFYVKESGASSNTGWVAK